MIMTWRLSQEAEREHYPIIHRNILTISYKGDVGDIIKRIYSVSQRDHTGNESGLAIIMKAQTMFPVAITLPMN